MLRESRLNLRIKQKVPVRWEIKDGNASGVGRVLNISTSGLLLEARTAALPIEKSILSISPMGTTILDFLPREGRLIWSKKTGFNGSKALCGIEFVNPAEEIISRLREKVQKGITRLTNIRRARSFFGTLLVISMLAMSAFVIKQYVDNHQQIVASYQLTLSAYEDQKSLTQKYAKELNTTNAMLAEVEKLMAGVKAENQDLQNLVATSEAALASTKAENQKFVAENQRIVTELTQLQKTNEQLAGELNLINERLRFFEGNVVSVKEGKEAILIYRGKIIEVRAKIREYQRQAHKAKIAAQTEKDRIGMLLGNNGYFVKDGQPFQPDKAAAAIPSNIKVDVQFFK